jgi:bacteriorhodopsin
MHLIQIAPMVIFPLTVGEGCLLLYFAGMGPNGAQVSWFMQLVIASTVSTTLFYVLEAFYGRCVLTSTFERHLEPLHYLMWMVATCIDSVTLHMLMAIQRRARGEDKLLCERNLAEVLLCTLTTFFAAFYGGLLRPASALNLVLMCTSFASFGIVLYRNYEAVRVATMDSFAVSEPLALRFLFLRRALLTKWCYYPIVWMLAASHTISIQTEDLLLTGLDLLKAVFAVMAWALYL